VLYRQQGGTPRTVAEQRQHGARAALARRPHPHPASAAPRAPCSPPYRADGCEGAHRLAVQLLRRDEPRPAARGSAVRHRSDVRNEGTRHSAHELILRPCSLLLSTTPQLQAQQVRWDRGQSGSRRTGGSRSVRHGFAALVRPQSACTSATPPAGALLSCVLTRSSFALRDPTPVVL